MRRKLLHTCKISLEDLPTVVKSHLERLSTGIADSQLWRHGQEEGAIAVTGSQFLGHSSGASSLRNDQINRNQQYIMKTEVRRSLEDLTVMLTAHCLQRNLLIFHKRPACAVIIRCGWLGIESKEAPVTILYDNTLDHFTALVPQWDQLKDLGEFVLRDSLPQTIYVTPSELEIRLSRFMTFKERS